MTHPMAARVALFALRPVVGPGPVADAFAWAASVGAPADALELARERLAAGWRLAGGQWVAPVGMAGNPGLPPEAAPLPGAPAPPLPASPPPARPPGGAAPGLPSVVAASLVSGLPRGRPTSAEAATALRSASKRPPVSLTGVTHIPRKVPPAPPGPDRYVNITTSLPLSLRHAIDVRVAALGLERAAYLRALVRADLASAGDGVPPEPPPAARGMWATPGRKSRRCGGGRAR